jgi:hypothetical protein
MSVVYFEDGAATLFLRGQFRAKAALRPIPAGLVCVDADGHATGAFRGLWRVAFPTRQPLPLGPISHPDGSATPAFLSAIR